MDVGIIFAVAAAVLGPIWAYLAAAKKLSGRINTSEASQLWDEAGKLRFEYKAELTELREITTRLRVRIEELDEKNEALHSENETLRFEVLRLQDENGDLKDRVHELEDRLTSSEKRERYGPS